MPKQYNYDKKENGKNATGRPQLWNSPEELQTLIDTYFAITDPLELTITGLALALNTDRHTLINYQNQDKFLHTIKRAKLKIEEAYEKRLIKRGASGDIFALKNFGWTDKIETENVQHIITETPIQIQYRETK